MNKYVLLLYVLFLANFLSAQGLIETNLTSNAILVQKWKETQLQSVNRSPSVSDTINLGAKGILDDFSYEGPYPDTSLWLDNFVFINRGFPIAPVTIGAATFDGLNADGYPYNFTASQTSSGKADYLTSKPINLSYPVSDSIYFSFYYQPQGRGNAPEQNDSLVLEFKNGNGWKNMWSKKGSTLSASDSSWKIVMIPVTNAAFLQKGFQFRFRNNATLSGSLDHWSIDYVYLNRIRNKNDTLFEDISFVYDTPSLLKTYSAMPWKHYGTGNMKTDYSTTIRNNHTTVKNGSFSYNIYDQAGTQVNTTYSGGSNNIDPYFPNGYVNYVPFTKPPLNYTIPTLSDSTKYTIECILNSTPDFCRENDTVRHTQVFSNYYAYDDGSAELAFGLGGFVGAMIAEQYTSTITDTLRCIDIYFDPIITNASLYNIRLKVWNDGGGKPGTAVFTSDSAFAPVYTQGGPNLFTRHYLKTPLNLSAGTFYIGFQQNTSQLINVGVDRNSNNQYKVFYNTTGNWLNSPNAGSLMMRPIFGSAADFVGISEKVKKNTGSITVFPNPANDKLYLRSNSENELNASYTITDLSGRTISEDRTSASEYIDISMLSEGIYFIRITNGMTVCTEKFIKIN